MQMLLLPVAPERRGMDGRQTREVSEAGQVARETPFHGLAAVSFRKNFQRKKGIAFKGAVTRLGFV
jgi:hypothetical protein